MAGKLEKIETELNKARAKRTEWEARVKDLEQKYKEAENTMIHDMVHAANLTPEQLALIIKQAAFTVPGIMPSADNEEFEEDDYEE